MLPLIDTELERVDRKHAQLTQLSSDLVEAMNLYHTLMKEPDRSFNPYMNYSNPHSMYATASSNAAMSGMYMPNMFQMPGNHPSAMPSLGKFGLYLYKRYLIKNMQFFSIFSTHAYDARISNWRSTANPSFHSTAFT